MKRLPYKRIESQVYRACKRAFREMLEADPDEHYYTFALFTNDAIQSLHPVANTEEELDLTVRKYNQTVDKEYGITSTHNGMRWSYGDWGVQDIGDEHFEDVNESLYSISLEIDDVDDQTADECIDRLWEAVLNGFGQLNADKLFGSDKKRKEVTLLIVGDLPEDFVNACAKRLNPPSVARRFIKWDPDKGDG